ncbi:putative phosphorylase b kinase regulatory subunit beta [Schistosoma japonicum]|uniref:Phosphorylase b kinase regulatory subunit n=3 Tax=Schistosoma japonicum TaxID=6182 RepID=A0A4Z2DME7_SCHJA|nr:Phosphorylase b kinase regulatory subunit beta [Schistosoma japonicum]TNN17716.1 putative phosphorylase b kinase regulatory subunit beta [Schistosoma japonicum]
MTVIRRDILSDCALKEKLDFYYGVVKNQILRFQHPISGLFPLVPMNSNCRYSHVRDSVYCATVVWALHQCFARINDDEGRHYELGQSAVKCMRGILMGWMQQSARLEYFKRVQNLDTCLHSRLDYETGEPIYDDQYKNLQMDCIGLYVIQLVQMIHSGLQIVYTKDEVAFVQNLVFYLERAYRIPDYGMWERGTKQNRNITELHASSICMAKAALESVAGFNIYGREGGHSSILFMDADAHSRNRIIMTNLLPRESASKGTDASLIPALCWPAYGTRSTSTRLPALERCTERLKGVYGFRRFTRDGYATVLDTNSDYQPGELMKFVGIESEWPMFFAYMIIENYLNGDREKAIEYDQLMQPLLVHPVSEEYPWLPKFYFVPTEELEKERQCRESAIRKSSFRLVGESRFLWGQSIYIISQLLLSGCLLPSDLDPISRRPSQCFSGISTLDNEFLFSGKSMNVTIQVVLISESVRLQQVLATYGIITQTPVQVEPIQIWSPDQLVRVGKFMGCSERLGLSGRPPRPYGQLGTSKFYRISGLTVLCYPLLFESQEFYLLHDMQVVIDEAKTDFLFLSNWWRLHGRPTFCFLMREDMVKVPGFDKLLRFLVSMKNGTVQEAHVVLGRAQKFVSSGFVEHLDFLPYWTAKGEYFRRLHQLDTGRSYRSLDILPKGDNLSSKSLNRSQSHITDEEIIRSMHAIDRKPLQKLTDQQVIEQATKPGDNPLNLAYQIAALHELSSRHNLDHCFSTGQHFLIVRDCVMELSRKAGIQQTWCVVRLSAALLSQFASSLAPSLSIILVCGKQLTVGIAQGPEVVVNKPLNPDELYALLREEVYSHDPVQFSLQQELILSVSSLLTSNKELFDGIKFIRLGWLLEAMKLKLESETCLDLSIDKDPYSHHPQQHNDGELCKSRSVYESVSKSLSSTNSGINTRSLGACHLYSLPPCQVKDLLLRTLKAGQDGKAQYSLNNANNSTTTTFSADVFTPGNFDTNKSAPASTRELSVITEDTLIKNISEHRARRSRLRRHNQSDKHSRNSHESSSAFTSTELLDIPKALFQRQLDGCLGVVPPTFYQGVYSILERSPHGILIYGKLLPQKPTLTDMTPYDLNFIDEVECLLRPICDPAYRSLVVETIMVIAVILQRNNELSFNEIVDIKLIIMDAMNAFMRDRHSNMSTDSALPHVERRMSWSEPDAISSSEFPIYIEFTSTPANATMGTTCYIAKSVLDKLLKGHIDLTNVSKDACCAM